MDGDEKSSPSFLLFFRYMKGKVHRVTYNVFKQVAELHMEDGSVKSVPMSAEEWQKMLEGNPVENFNKLLNEE